VTQDGEDKIRELVTALQQSGKDWRQVADVLTHVRGWAVRANPHAASRSARSCSTSSSSMRPVSARSRTSCRYCFVLGVP
jgi:hypothetical protein